MNKLKIIFLFITLSALVLMVGCGESKLEVSEQEIQNVYTNMKDSHNFEYISTLGRQMPSDDLKEISMNVKWDKISDTEGVIESTTKMSERETTNYYELTGEDTTSVIRYYPMNEYWYYQSMSFSSYEKLNRINFVIEGLNNYNTIHRKDNTTLEDGTEVQVYEITVSDNFDLLEYGENAQFLEISEEQYNEVIQKVKYNYYIDMNNKVIRKVEYDLKSLFSDITEVMSSENPNYETLMVDKAYVKLEFKNYNNVEVNIPNKAKFRIIYDNMASEVNYQTDITLIKNENNEITSYNYIAQFDLMPSGIGNVYHNLNGENYYLYDVGNVTNYYNIDDVWYQSTVGRNDLKTPLSTTFNNFIIDSLRIHDDSVQYESQVLEDGTNVDVYEVTKEFVRYDLIKYVSDKLDISEDEIDGATIKYYINSDEKMIEKAIITFTLTGTSIEELRVEVEYNSFGMVMLLIPDEVIDNAIDA